LVGNQQIIGKPVGSDTVNHKSTYPQLLSMEGARAALQNQIKLSKEYLKKTGLNTILLNEITDLVASRDH